jgi:ferritin-like metal-binding protein YciE
MADVAGHAELKQGIQIHLEETRSQQSRVEEILSRHKAEPREHVDQAMQAMLQEAEKWASMVQDRDLRDIGIIASAQRSSTTRLRCTARLPPGPSSSG